MRIGIITGEFPPMEGGVGAYSERLAEHLMAEGQEVFVLSAENSASRQPIHLTSVVARWNMRAWLQARVWAQRNELDIISLQYQTAAFGMSPFIHFLPQVLRTTPVVTTFHDLRFPYLFPRAGGLRTRIVEHLARKSAACITTNTEDAARLHPTAPNTMIPIGSNVPITPLTQDQCQALRQQITANDKDFIIGYFGLLNRSKGVDLLLEAVARLRGAGVPARLLIIGGTVGASDSTNETYADELETQMAALNLGEYVQQTGYVDDANASAYLQVVDAVALPFRDGASYRRGSLLAALEHGCAIVTTVPTTPTAEFVDGETMLLVETENVEGLTTALKRLYDDAALRAEIGAGAKETARRFAWSSIAAAHMALFGQMLEQSN
jgi:glycosyltransferase involved in cell wall biosynthesis